MLAIRLQRTGRKGHASFRVIVQDSRWSPKSGKFVSHLGSFDPHTKKAVLEIEKAQHFLKNGAQPSDRVARLLKAEGVKLPKWVELTPDKKRAIRNPDKLRKNRPASVPESEKPAPPAQTSEEEVSVGKEVASESQTESASQVLDEVAAEPEVVAEAKADEKVVKETTAEPETKTAETAEAESEDKAVTLETAEENVEKPEDTAPEVKA